MAVRSATIKKAWRRVIQGEEDPEWNYEEWNDYYHDAVDAIATEIFNAGLPFYKQLNQKIDRDGNGLYPLPTDCRAVTKIMDESNGDAIWARCDDGGWEVEHQVFELIAGSIRLKDWNGTEPTSLYIDYDHFPTDLGDWDGTDDAATVVPDAPLNTNRGSRLIASIIVIYAKVKDEDMTVEQLNVMDKLISDFVERMGPLDQTAPEIVGE